MRLLVCSTLVTTMQRYEIAFPVAHNYKNHRGRGGRLLWHLCSTLPKLCFFHVWDVLALTCPSKHGIALGFTESVFWWQGSAAPSFTSQRAAVPLSTSFILAGTDVWDWDSILSCISISQTLPGLTSLEAVRC